MIKVMDKYNAISYINPINIEEILPTPQGCRIVRQDRPPLDTLEVVESLVSRCNEWWLEIGGLKR